MIEAVGCNDWYRPSGSAGLLLQLLLPWLLLPWLLLLNDDASDGAPTDFGSAIPVAYATGTDGDTEDTGGGDGERFDSEAAGACSYGLLNEYMAATHTSDAFLLVC